jgi:hypothetical protein
MTGETKLICKICRSELSVAVQMISTKDPETPKLELKDQCPVTGPGTVIKSWESIQALIYGHSVPTLDFTPQYWMNPIDVEQFVTFVKDDKKLSGCCGLSGFDGPNMCCKKCKSVVGTRQNDCITPNIFIPDSQNTQWIETES